MFREPGFRGLQIQWVYFGPSEKKHPILYNVSQNVFKGLDLTTKSHRLHLPEIVTTLSTLALIAVAYSHFLK